MNKKLALSTVAFVVFAMSSGCVLAAESCQPLICPKEPPPIGDKFGPHPMKAMENKMVPFHGFKMNDRHMRKMQKAHQKLRAEIDAKLNLTEEQKCIIEKNRQESRQKMKPIFDAVNAKKAKIDEIYSSNLPPEEKDKQVEIILAELKDLRLQAEKIGEEGRKNFESVLTPAQKTELEKIKQEHKAARDKKFKHHKHHKRQISPPLCEK